MCVDEILVSAKLPGPRNLGWKPVSKFLLLENKTAALLCAFGSSFVVIIAFQISRKAPEISELEILNDEIHTLLTCRWSKKYI